MAKETEIDLKQIKDLAKALKKKDTNWAEKLAKSMGVAVTKVYDIVNSRLKHQQNRLLFITHAKPLLDKIEAEYKEGLDLIKK